MLALNSELWFLFFDQVENRYAPQCMGKVTRVQGSSVVAGGRRHELAYPYFTSRAAADAYIVEHPFTAPTIK